ncbi:MAG: ribosome small subunit-dependent GTPase A [Bacteroidaceae bacterium]|nr:ribosome small subunit-dependent GTPase A [Bacteroidaceae bacterium]
MHGLVVRNTGYSYTVKSDAGEVFECKVKGNFRIRGIRTTNPVAIGDRVTFIPYETLSPTLPHNGEGDHPDGSPHYGGDVRRTEGVCAGLITAIDDRKNYIIRKSTNLSKQSHIIAANVDMCFLIVTIQQPETPLQFIDRFLATAEAYSVPVTLIFNKIDVVTDEWKDYLDGVINLYETVGYPCRRISALTGEGVEELRAELQGKITLLSGNSGVGKSTLINTLFPHLNLRTSEISDAYNTGKHTTTFSEMYEIRPPLPFGHLPLYGESHAESLPSGNKPDGSPHRGGDARRAEGVCGYIIDTPGIKGFGTFDMKREEVSHYFKEIFRFSADCRFNNCTHTHEPHCAVREAVERHDIAESRYNSYLSMLEDEKEDKYRPAY